MSISRRSLNFKAVRGEFNEEQEEEEEDIHGLSPFVKRIGFEHALCQFVPTGKRNELTHRAHTQIKRSKKKRKKKTYKSDPNYYSRYT
jgi:hypothetical protein